MIQFEVEKNNLLSDLENVIRQNPENTVVHLLKELIKNLNSHFELKGQFSRIVIDSLDFKFEIGEKIIDFERFFMDKTNLIESSELRQMAKYLKKRGLKPTFFGQARTNANAHWIYFDTVLDLEKLKRKFYLGSHIKVHQNLDPRSGTESGFVDDLTGEGLMGKLLKR